MRYKFEEVVENIAQALFEYEKLARFDIEADTFEDLSEDYTTTYRGAARYIAKTLDAYFVLADNLTEAEMKALADGEFWTEVEKSSRSTERRPRRRLNEE